MDALKIVRVRKALGLKRDMVGVRFMPYKKEYDLSEAEERRHIALCEVVIIAVAEKIPGNVLEEDPKLLMWYDQAVTRMGGA